MHILLFFSGFLPKGLQRLACQLLNCLFAANTQGINYSFIKILLLLFFTALSLKLTTLHMQRNYCLKYAMVLKGPSNATGLNVLQGKAYEKPCWPQYIRDQYVLKGPCYNLEMNLNPLSIYICTHCPQVAQRC